MKNYLIVSWSMRTKAMYMVLECLRDLQFLIQKFFIGVADKFVIQNSKFVIIYLSFFTLHSNAQTLTLRTPHFAIGLLSNTDSISGVQIGLFSNFANKIDGVQLAPLANACTTELKGIQLSGVSNISTGVRKGMQIAALTNVCSENMRGLQIAAYNYADSLSGSQFGLINFCIHHPRGVQVGLINYSRDTTAHKIGLVNINPKTRMDLLAFLGTSSKLNMALRFRNRSTYNIIGMGTHYMGIDEKFSGAIYYRIGQYFKINRRLSLSGDIGYYHVETFEENNDAKPERLYSLQARLNADYKISPTLGAFMSLGYGDTRYYSHNRHYRSRLIFETGLTFNLRNRTTEEKTLPVKNSPRRMPSLYEDVQKNSIFAFDNPENKKKHPWRAAVETFGINVAVQSFDRFVLNADFAQINFKTIKHNIETGFVWDNDQFSTNLFAHPYHGGLYFNAARSNGLTFWESAPYAFCGSLMWETICETEPPAINDLMATTVGGIAIGEVTHRISALVYDDRKRGWSRFWREFLGGVICPIGALNRIISGDAWKVRHEYYKYHDYDRLPVHAQIGVGYRYLADNNSLFRGEGTPYINVALDYGDPFNEEERKPYDYFTADITFGLSSNQPLVSSIHLLGRLWGAPVRTGKIQTEFGLFQHFNYYDSQPVKDGTSLVPYRISEAASAGPGLICRFPSVGNLTRLEQRIFVNGILLGGSLTDHYNVIDRDYNMGSGYSAKTSTLLGFGKYGFLSVLADYYRIFTWKGYKDSDLETVDPIYLNAQGDKSNATLLVVSAHSQWNLTNKIALELTASHYWRYTHYARHNNISSNTFAVRMGLVFKL